MKYIYILLLLMLSLASCLRRDLDELLASQQEQAAALEELRLLCDTVRMRISALEELVDASGKGDYVTGVTELPDGSGYRISFLNHPEVVIYHGKDGQEGNAGEDGAVEIGVSQDTDGKYYWQQRISKGSWEWIQDSEGRKVPVGMSDNTSGEMPRIGVDGNGYWTVNGIVMLDADGNPVSVQGLKGDAGDGWIKNIQVNEKQVQVTLSADNSVISLPRYIPLTLSFPSGQSVNGTAGTSCNLGYVLEGADASTQVEASVPSGWSVQVNRSTDLTGTIVVTLPSGAVSGNYRVLVFVSDGKGRSVVKTVVVKV